MNLTQVFDPAERLLDGGATSKSAAENPPFAGEGSVLTYGVETFLKGLGYSIQKAIRLAAILAPLSLLACGKSPEDVQADVREAMDEVYRQPDLACDEIAETIERVLVNKGYEPSEEGQLLNSNAEVAMDRYKGKVTVKAEDEKGHLIIMKSARCKAEDLQR